MKPRVFHYIAVYIVLLLVLVLSLFPTNAQKPANNDIVCSNVSG